MGRYTANGVSYDQQWVTDGDSAQKMLFEQGYTVDRFEWRRKVRWVLMIKQVDQPPSYRCRTCGEFNVIEKWAQCEKCRKVLNP